jgi:hypothetical protein
MQRERLAGRRGAERLPVIVVGMRECELDRHGRERAVLARRVDAQLGAILGVVQLDQRERDGLLRRISGDR